MFEAITTYIDNDPTLLSEFLDIVSTACEYYLCEQIECWFLDHVEALQITGEYPQLFVDMLNAAIQETDWKAVAKHYQTKAYERNKATLHSLLEQ